MAGADSSEKKRTSRQSKNRKRSCSFPPSSYSLLSRKKQAIQPRGHHRQSRRRAYARQPVGSGEAFIIEKREGGGESELRREVTQPESKQDAARHRSTPTSTPTLFSQKKHSYPLLKNTDRPQPGRGRRRRRGRLRSRRRRRADAQEAAAGRRRRHESGGDGDARRQRRGFPGLRRRGSRPAAAAPPGLLLRRRRCV